jgi:hypothetical protein
MFDALLKNPKLLEGLVGSFLRMIPPEVYAEAAAQLKRLADHAEAIRVQLDRIEAAGAANAERIDFLDTVCRTGIPDAGVLFAEREMYHPDRRTHVGGIPIADIARHGDMNSVAPQRGPING